MTDVPTEVKCKKCPSDYSTVKLTRVIYPKKYIQ